MFGIGIITCPAAALIFQQEGTDMTVTKDATTEAAGTTAADTAAPPKETLKQRIEKDWSELEGFVKTMELKLFGSKLHQKAVHPLSNEEAWVEVPTDQTQDHKDKVAAEVAARAGKTSPKGGAVAPGTEQGAATGIGGQPNVVQAEDPAPGASAAVLGTATGT